MPRSKPIEIMPGQRWLTVHQAAAYSQIGMQRLKALAQEGKIKGSLDTENHKTGKWVFDKESIDIYMSVIVNNFGITEKAIELNRKLGL